MVGGEGNDLLDGGEGSDHMEGGAGFDTYYIDGNDTVYDSDGIGKIIFSGGLLHSEATAANFVRDPDGAQDIWYSVGADGKRDGAMIAGRIGQDLKITRAGDTVFLRGFFDAAAQQNGTFSSLGITLGTAQEAQPDTPLAETLTANGLDGQYNTFYSQTKQKISNKACSKDKQPDITFLRCRLIFAHTFSIGFNSGEYGGSGRMICPSLCAISRSTAIL